MRRLFVLAGSYAQFRDFVREVGSDTHPEVKFLADERVVRGITDFEFVRVGDWYRRRDASRILELLQERGVSEVTENEVRSQIPRKAHDLDRLFKLWDDLQAEARRLKVGVLVVRTGELAERLVILDPKAPASGFKHLPRGGTVEHRRAGATGGNPAGPISVRSTE